MRTKRLLTAALVGCVSFGIGGCGDSTAPNANLTETQLSELVDAMAAVGFGFTPSSPGGAASRMSSLISLTVDENVACPVSGNVHVTGGFTLNDAGTQFTMNLTQKHQDCAATSQQTGKTWTFNGDPNITANLTVNVTDPTTGAGNFSGTEKGGINFATDGLSGHCSIDLSISATTDALGVTSGTVSGTVCGKDVSQQFTDATA